MCAFSPAGGSQHHHDQACKGATPMKMLQHVQLLISKKNKPDYFVVRVQSKTPRQHAKNAEIEKIFDSHSGTSKGTVPSHAL